MENCSETEHHLCSGVGNKGLSLFKFFFSQSSSVVDYAQKLNSHFPLFLTNHWVWNKISTTGATTGAGTAYPYDVPKFSPAFSGIRVALSLFVLFSLGQCNICPSIYDF
jgi:hypothetical protein